jgi:hypothetical protein
MIEYIGGPGSGVGGGPGPRRRSVGSVGTKDPQTVFRDRPHTGGQIRRGSSRAQAAGSVAGGAIYGAGPEIAKASNTTLALERLAKIVVPPELLERGLRNYAEPAARKSSSRLSAILLDQVIAMGLPGNPIEVAISAQVRILALACVVRGRVLEEWVQRGDPGGIVLFHGSLFMAAAVEPLILSPPDGIGFDPESLRRSVLRLAAVKGSG